MLILTRKLNEEIRISDDIVIKVVRLQGNQVSIGIEAPKNVVVHREEVYQRIQSEQGVRVQDFEPLKVVEA